MPDGLRGDSPKEVFRIFREHLNGVLHKTITDFPLVQTITGNRAHLDFRQDGSGIAVDVGKRYHLYLGQTLQANGSAKDGYELKTLGYAYRIAEGPSLNDSWLIRWEYNSREQGEQQHALHPRNHCHLPSQLVCFGTRTLSLSKMHISTGWVTVEEVIRFLIHELKVRPKNTKWDQHLRDSERLFRKWTARSV